MALFERALTCYNAVFQTIGASIFVSCAQALFVNKLLERVRQLAPQIDRNILIISGATELRKVYNGDTLSAVLRGYLAGIQDAFLLTVALLAASVLFSFLVPWWNIGKEVERRKPVSRNQSRLASSTDLQ